MMVGDATQIKRCQLEQWETVEVFWYVFQDLYQD